jgi:hypothetical protein
MKSNGITGSARFGLVTVQTGWMRVRIPASAAHLLNSRDSLALSELVVADVPRHALRGSGFECRG